MNLNGSLSLLGFAARAICFPPCPLGRQLLTQTAHINYKDNLVITFTESKYKLDSFETI